jgi:drug/metabolite transporter (DMT)-like permease
MPGLPATDPAAAAKTGPTNILAVVLWMIGALLSFSGTAVSIRTLADRLNIFEILSIRSGSGLIILLAAALARPALRQYMRPSHMALHAVRNTTHFAAQYGWALSLTLLPLATVFALEFTMPLWVALIAVWMLGERMTLSRAASIVFGFLGVLVILRPGLEAFRPAALVVLAAAFGFGIAVAATKKLTGYTSTFAILFWMNTMQFPMALAGSDPLFFLRLDAWQIPAVLAVAICGLSSHYCLTNAFRAGDAILVVPLDFLRIPLIAVVGWLIYGEALDGFVFAGAGLIVAGVLGNLWSETRPAPVPVA